MVEEEGSEREIKTLTVKGEETQGASYKWN